MEYIKKFVLRGLFGITFGVFINQLVYLIMALQGSIVQISSDIIISQFFLASLTGFYCTGISVIFEIEEWSLLRQTITHSIAMLPFFPISIYAGWIPGNLIGRVIFILNYILVYLIIWFSFKKYWEKKAKELNEGLKKRNNI
ncbi:DUF3021 domain-containing protein [Fonticella tunisiensis]|uniref:DUF3021 family protein n=1 Tax=Fonticella tunisiensis TaxID=1096341 RepID=A0A4R7KW75_9CLOT|nr:DUF3021 domain-containing protein [Fonticella tunisiensis]TDT63801.1 DUF3021 family protein [Fonticella tunisiensis]